MSLKAIREKKKKESFINSKIEYNLSNKYIEEVRKIFKTIIEPNNEEILRKVSL